MKKFLPISLVVMAMMFSGCAWFKHGSARRHHEEANKTVPAASQSIVTPDDSLLAKVLAVNTVGRFVVLNFPDGRMPKIDEHMFLYRNGLKTAEVKIVGPQEDFSIVADMVSGEAHIGDTVRNQ